MDAIVELLENFFEELFHFSMGNLFRFSKEHNLSMPQMGALMQIYHKQTCAVSDVGCDMGISSAAASQMLERLVQQDYIQRSEDSVDRRIKNIVLTEKGLNLVKEGLKSKNERINELIQTLSIKEQELAISVFSILQKKIKEIKQKE